MKSDYRIPPNAYPATRRDGTVEDYFGVAVADPYRWLEDDNSPETKAWVEEQNRLAFSLLDRIPSRPRIEARLAELWNFPRMGPPVVRGEKLFYVRNSGLQNQAPLYVADGAARAAKGEGRLLLDPNSLSEEGTVALQFWKPSEDGRLLAYGLSESGSDWTTVRVLDVESGEGLGDEVRWLKGSEIAWRSDGAGFWYVRFPEPREGAELSGISQGQYVHWHRLGTPQSADPLVFSRPDQPEWYLDLRPSDDGRWLLIIAGEGCKPETAVFLMDAGNQAAGARPLLDRMDATWLPAGTAGPSFQFFTNLGAPRGRIVAVDIGAGPNPPPRELVPEDPEGAVIEAAQAIGGRLVLRWMRHAASALSVHDAEGRPIREVALPGIGSVSEIAGRPDRREAYVAYSSFTTPPSILELDAETGEARPFFSPGLDLRAEDYETSQHFYASRDGTRIPLFLVRRKGTRKDGRNPCLLYGYGGFNVSLTPWYSTFVMAWLDMGGTYALANIRGGGEYGMEWYDAGRLANKRNVFDDFIAAAEWLIAEGWTSTPRLAVNGASNGGLLVGACLCRRPELFGAAIPEVGVMDMLRFHKFTLGWGWKSDYGSSETEEGFRALYAYSPLHNLRPGVSYPPTLVCTGDHDDRVVPAHSHKFTATLQACQASDAPVLTRIETDAGHGAGMPLAKAIRVAADKLAFLRAALDMD